QRIFVALRRIRRVGDYAPERDGEKDRQQLEPKVAEQDRILPSPVLSSPHGERGTVNLGARLEQRGQHLAEAVRVEIAQQLAFVGDRDLTELLGQDQDDG